MKIQQISMCMLGVAWLSMVACSKEGQQHEPNTASTKNGEAMVPASRTRNATDQIADARCERERVCGNIGADKSYSSTQDCLARIRSDWKDDLNARECPGGVDQQQLDECLTQIRAESCGNPIDTLARLTECTSGQICVEHR